MNRVGAGQLALGVAVALGAVGCGSSKAPSSPTGDSIPPPAAQVMTGTVLTVTSAETGAAVAGAAFTIAGRSGAGSFTQTYTTNNRGEFTLDRGVHLTPQATVDVRADGFLERATLLRANDTHFSLWPASSATGLDMDFSATLVYFELHVQAQNTSASPLRRMPSSSRTMRVAFGATLQDARAESAHRDAIAAVNHALDGAAEYASSPARLVILCSQPRSIPAPRRARPDRNH